MEARENLRKEREDLKNYSSRINFDSMFFKGQKILGGILLSLFFIYFLWMAYAEDMITPFF